MAQTSRRNHPAGASERQRKPAAEAEIVVPPAAAPSEPPPATAQEACRRALDAIVYAFPEVIAAQIDKAKEGSHQHAKFLCEFAGLSGALLSPAAAQEDSLARLLLDRLQIGNEEMEDEPARPSSVL